jgi:hypothetical protein
MQLVQFDTDSTIILVQDTTKEVLAYHKVTDNRTKTEREFRPIWNNTNNRYTEIIPGVREKD